MKKGDIVFRAGDQITAAVIGTLAGMNVQIVAATRRPIVAVLSTGDELVDDGSELGPGQIRESNKTMLIRLVTDIDCDVVDYGIVRDDEAELEEVLRHASQNCDAIVTSGGVSMGDYDVVKAVLGRIADMQWMQIAIKPAKPFAFGTLNGTPIFGLPGNPVSSFVSFELFARPALRRMAGHRNPHRPTVAVTAGTDFKRNADGMPDPSTGRFMGISTAYRITAQPAFVVDPDPARPVGILGLAAEEWRKASFQATADALVKSTTTRIVQDVPPGTTEAQAPRLERIIQELPSKDYFLRMRRK